MTRRPWTAQDQITAEVAAACGVSWLQIGKILGRADKNVKTHIVPAAAEKHREANRRYSAANVDKCTERTRQWRKLNRNYCRDRDRRYCKNNANKVRENKRRWRESNLDRARELQRCWRKQNPNKVRELARQSAALRRGSGRRRALIPIAARQVELRRALWRHRCAFCNVDANHSRNHGRKRLTIDHVLALTNQGLDEASNIMPVCFACNCSKNATHVEEWYRRQPFFTEARWRKIQRHCPAAVVGQLPLTISLAVAEPA